MGKTPGDSGTYDVNMLPPLKIIFLHIGCHIAPNPSPLSVVLCGSVSIWDWSMLGSVREDNIFFPRAVYEVKKMQF